MADHKTPSDWLCLKFTDVLDVQGGTQPPKSQFIDEATDGYIRLLQIRDFGKKPIPTFIPDTTKLKRCKKDDLLIGRYGASLGRICTGMEGAYNVALAKVITPSSVDQIFLRGYLNSAHFQGALRLLSRSAQNGFNKGDLETFDFLLPPLAEQKVIADKLDTLLAQVETTKARLERIPQILKRFRQSVLAAAVSGRLTKDWRYTEKTVEEVCSLCFDGPFGSKLKTADYTPKGVRVVRLENIGHLFFDNDKKTFVSEEKYASLKKNTLQEGDVLFSSFVDEQVRVCSLGKLDSVYINKADCFCLRPNLDEVRPEYLAFTLASLTSYSQIKEQVQGVTRPRINLKILKSLVFQFPSLALQTEIVGQVNQLFTHADRIEQQVQAALERVNHLTQSILAKAFRGELTEQWRKDNPELVSGENSAAALLERIKAERAVNSRAGKKTKPAKNL